MPADIPLTPESARVVAAFDAAMGIDDSTGLFEDSHNALVAALREVAAVMEEAVPRHRLTAWSNGYRQSTIDTIAGVRDIADNIEQAITYAGAPADG